MSLLGRIFAPLAVLTLLAAPLAGARPENPIDRLEGNGFGCATLGPTLVACGAVQATPGSVGTATGVATGSVDWTLVLDVSHPYDSYEDTASGPAAVLLATGHYTTASCVHAALYANGELVAETLWYC